MALRDAEYFDGWYADMPASPRKDAIEQRHLGLPAYLLSTSLLTWDGLAEVVVALDVGPGQTLLDLACGRGGYGLEVAARTGAELLGVDFSAEAVRQATAGAGGAGRFLIGDLVATGLPDASVDAVLCVDAVQFAVPPAAAYAELLRVLRPGGRAVLTCWEAVDPTDEAVVERLRGVDLAGGLSGAGFTAVRAEERPAWREAERAMWQEAAALDPGDDHALQAFHDEGVRSLATFDLVRRVLSVGERPAAGERSRPAEDPERGRQQRRAQRLNAPARPAPG